MHGGGSSFANLQTTGSEGGRDLRDGPVQSYNFTDEETEAPASQFASLWPSFLIYKMGTVTSPLQSWCEDLLYAVGPAQYLLTSQAGAQQI